MQAIEQRATAIRKQLRPFPFAPVECQRPPRSSRSRRTSFRNGAQVQSMGGDELDGIDVLSHSAASATR